MDAPRRLEIALAGALIGLATVGVYWQVWDHAFVEFDDPLYVTGNRHVLSGLSAANVRWAFVTTDAFLWHPVTWLSYLLSAELHGAGSAGPWVLTDVGLHAASAIVLLFAWAGMTRQLVPAVFVAALFALHPLQTEAVAWVSGRKDVLAGLFFMLTLLAWHTWTRSRRPGHYACVLVCYVLSLSAKASLVAMPVLLLALDYWPLQRLESTSRLRARVVEKLPLIAIAIAFVAIQLVFVGSSWNVWVEDPPLPERVVAAGMSIVAMLGRILWPFELAIVQPNPAQMGLGGWSAAEIGGAFLLLIGTTAGALALARKIRSPLIGWIWFVVMLLPMSGIVPAGLRVMHDRYGYVPLIGVAILVAHPVWEWASRSRSLRISLSSVGLIVLAASAWISFHQIGAWRDTATLYQHALNVTERNAIVLYSRGVSRARSGDTDGAITDFQEAIAIHPHYPDARTSLGWLLHQEGRIDEALPHLQEAVDARPDWTLALVNLANALVDAGRPEKAAIWLKRAIEIGPSTPDGCYRLGHALARVGALDAAEAQYREALRLDPSHSRATLAIQVIEYDRRARARPGQD